MLIGVDRFMSEARALTSLASNAVATVVISMSENACHRETLNRMLDAKSSAAPGKAWDDLKDAKRV